MLKNKLKIITFLTVIILALTIPIVRAEDVEGTPSEILDSSTDDTQDIDSSSDITTTLNENPESTNSEGTQTATTITEDVKQGDVYLSGDNITVDYAIDGNLFVLANNVTINSQIAGDAFICANTVTVSESAYIYSNLFTFSKNVNINGIVYDLYVASENTTINGYVYRDLRAGSKTVNIFGTVGRNAFIDCETLTITPNTSATSEIVINGNLTYSSNQEATIPNGSVNGETNFKRESDANHNSVQHYILSLLTFIATVMIIWLIFLWLTPNFLKKTATYLTTKKVLPVIGFGILTPIVSILLAILCFVLGITSAFGIILLLTLVILMAISVSTFVITINSIICNKLKMEKNIQRFGILIACATTLWLINLIPYIGSIIEIVAIVLGLGILVASLVLKEKVEDAN